MKFIAVIAVIAALFSVPVHAADTWTIDPDHTSIGFKVKHLMVSNVKGDFRRFTGSVETDEKNLTLTKINVVIETASINTGIDKRDDHLRSADFFDVAKYPSMTFVSRKVVKKGERYQLVGDLTIRGITREVTLDVEGPTPPVRDPWGGLRRGATATGTINRKDFGLTWNKALEAGGVAVGDEVQIAIEVELIRK